MTRIRIGAAALGRALLLGAGAAQAQETTGRVTGRVTDQETGLPLGGVTALESISLLANSAANFATCPGRAWEVCACG